MAIIKATYECDICHLPIEDKDSDFDYEPETYYEGEDYCMECLLEHELSNAKHNYLKHKRWLNQTHLKKLKMLKARLDYVKEKQKEFCFKPSSRIKE